MTAAQVLQHVLDQLDKVPREEVLKPSPLTPMDVPLVNRSVAVEATAGYLKQRYEAMVDASGDRTQYPVVCYWALSGLGKTRMLHEDDAVYEEAGMGSLPRVSVVVSYGNGCTPDRDWEPQFSGKAAFAWRLLHAFFVRGKRQGVKWHDLMPGNASALSVETALEVIALYARKDGLEVRAFRCSCCSPAPLSHPLLRRSMLTRPLTSHLSAGGNPT